MKVDFEGFKSVVVYRRFSLFFGYFGGCIRWFNCCYVVYILVSYVGLDVVGYYGFVIFGKCVVFGVFV